MLLAILRPRRPDAGKPPAASARRRIRRGDRWNRAADGRQRTAAHRAGARARLSAARLGKFLRTDRPRSNGDIVGGARAHPPHAARLGFDRPSLGRSAIRSRRHAAGIRIRRAWLRKPGVARIGTDRTRRRLGRLLAKSQIEMAQQCPPLRTTFIKRRFQYCRGLSRFCAVRGAKWDCPLL